MAEPDGPTPALDGAREHPSPEELLAYHLRRLGPAEAEAMRDHLADCPACAGTVLDFESFPDLAPPREDLRLTDADAEAGWEALRERTGTAPVPRPAPPAPLRPPAVARGTDRWRGAYRLAASLLLVAAAALGAWALHLRGTVAELSRPRANVALVELAPLEPATRLRDAPGEEAEVPAWAGRVLLILDFGPPLPYTTYAVRIADGEGTEVWSQQGLRRSPDGQFTLELPRRLLPPGAYRVQLEGVQGETRTPVAVYLMDLRAGGGP